MSHRFLHGPDQGPVRMTGTVNSDDDSRHFNPPLPTALSAAFRVDLTPASATPQTWRAYVSWTTSHTAPDTMTEGAAGQFTEWDTGHDPADPVDQAIMATKRAVFPLHGLMP